MVAWRLFGAEIFGGMTVGLAMVVAVEETELANFSFACRKAISEQ